MEKTFPMEFTLDDGTQVLVQKTGAHSYDFTLKPDQGGERHFTVRDDEEFTEEKEQALDFDQLNALRTFWLKTRDEE